MTFLNNKTDLKLPNIDPLIEKKAKMLAYEMSLTAWCFTQFKQFCSEGKAEIDGREYLINDPFNNIILGKMASNSLLFIMQRYISKLNEAELVKMIELTPDQSEMGIHNKVQDLIVVRTLFVMKNILEFLANEETPFNIEQAVQSTMNIPSDEAICAVLEATYNLLFTRVSAVDPKAEDAAAFHCSHSQITTILSYLETILSTANFPSKKAEILKKCVAELNWRANIIQTPR